MNQQEVEAWIQQQGGAGAVQYSRATTQVDNPAADPLTAKAAGVTFDPAAPAKLTVSTEKWTNPKTGAVLHVKRRDDGNFDIVDQANPDPTKTTNTQATTPHIEGTPIYGPGGAITGYDNTKPITVNRDANGQQVGSAIPLTGEALANWERDQNEAAGRGRYTNAELQQRNQTATDKQEVPGHPGIYHVVRKTVSGTDDHYEDASGKTVPAPVDQKPGTIVDDGHGGKVLVTTDPATGTPKSTPIPGVSGKPDQVTVDGVVYERQPDGTYAPAKGLPTTKPGQLVTVNGEQFWATPNADPSQPPTLTRASDLPGAASAVPTDDGPQFAPGMSASDYLQQRRAYWMQQRKAGVSQKDIDAGWDRDVQIATAKQNEATTAASQQNQRLSSAMSGFNQATTAVENLNKYLPVGSDLGGKALEAMLGLQYGQAQRMGGYGAPAGTLTVPPAPAGPDPSTQVAAIPAAPAPAPATSAPATSAPAPAFRPAPPTNVQPAAPAPTVQSAASVAAPTAQAPALASPAVAPAPVAAPAATPAGQGSRGMDTLPGQPMFPTPARAPGDLTGYGTLNLPQGIDLSTPPVPGNPDSGPVGMAPGMGLPVLAHSMAAAQLPWRMSEDEYRRYKAAGVPDAVIFSVPGVAA